jgi:hypothetical protein
MSEPPDKDLAVPSPLTAPPFVTPLEQKLAAFGTVAGAVIGSGIGLATGGIGIAATVPLAAAGTFVGSVVGRKLEDRGITFEKMVSTGVSQAIAIGGVVSGPADDAGTIATVRRAAGVVVGGLGCAAVAGTAAAVAIPGLAVGVVGQFLKAWGKGLSEGYRSQKDVDSADTPPRP